MEILGNIVSIEHSEPQGKTDTKYHRKEMHDMLNYNIKISKDIIETYRKLVLFNRYRIGFPSLIEPYVPKDHPA